MNKITKLILALTFAVMGIIVSLKLNTLTKEVNATTCLPKVYYNIATRTCNPTSQMFDTTSGVQCGGTRTCEGIYGAGNCYLNTSACLLAHPAPTSCLPKVFFDIVATNTITGYNAGTCKPTVANFNTSTGLICNPTATTNGMNCDQYLYSLAPTKSGNGCYTSSADCVTPVYAGEVKPDFRWIYNSSAKKCVQTNHRYSNNTSNGTYDRDVDDPAHNTCAANAGATCYKSLSDCSTANLCTRRYFCDERTYTCQSDTTPTNHTYSNSTDIDCGHMSTGLDSTGLTCYKNIHDPQWATYAKAGSLCYPTTTQGLADCQATCKKPVLPTSVSTPITTPTSVPTSRPSPGPNTCSKSFIIKLVTNTATPVTGTPLSTPRSTPVAVTPTPVPTATPVIISCNKNLDIALIIDRSSSMNDKVDNKTKLEWAKDAARKFVNAIVNTGTGSVNVAVVSFGAQGDDGTGTKTPLPDWNSTLNSSLTNTFTGSTTITNAIDSVNYKKWGTCIECGLRIGNGQLTNLNNRKVGVLISDGMANHTWNGSNVNGRQAAIAMANSGRTSGIEYRTIGYGVKSLSQIDESTLINIAGSPVNYQYRPNVSDWSSSFLTVLKDLCAGVPTSSPIATLNASADSSVYAGTNAAKNFGTYTGLSVDGSPIVTTYFKYDLTSLAGKTIKKATLGLYTTYGAQSLINLNVSPTTWVESTINYNNKPALGSLVTSFQSGPANYTTQVDITDFVNNNKGNVVSFALTTKASDSFYFRSKESSNKPTIIVY